MPVDGPSSPLAVAATSRQIPRMDIGSRNGWPADEVTNFAAHRFVFDEVECGGMEGLLQALKFEDPDMQPAVCALAGAAAKRRGSGRTRTWQKAQTLWWKGIAMDRHGEAYQAFLDRAYRALFEQCPAFRRALYATGTAVLTHSIGWDDPARTILTVEEFCGRLMRLRSGMFADASLVENPFPACHPCH